MNSLNVRTLTFFNVDLTKLDPVIYSGMYHSIGHLPKK